MSFKDSFSHEFYPFKNQAEIDRVRGITYEDIIAMNGKHPKNPNIESNEGVKELYERSVSQFLSCAQTLLSCAKQKKPPPFSVFGKNFLSGL